MRSINISIAGTWTTWSKWNMCSTECGNGVQTRKRSCSEIQNTQETRCKGATKEIRGCTINNCSSKRTFFSNIIHDSWENL